MNKRQLGSEKKKLAAEYLQERGDMRWLPAITAAGRQKLILLQKRGIFDFY